LNRDQAIVESIAAQVRSDPVTLGTSPKNSLKENKHEAGRTKKFAQAQETKETPCYEEVHGGQEIKGGGSVKMKD
jgi:hypothetical protein